MEKYGQLIIYKDKEGKENIEVKLLKKSNKYTVVSVNDKIYVKR